jgi:hypothetical protein
MPKTVKSKVIYDAWITTGRDPRLRGKWMSDEVWYRTMIRVFPNMKTLGVTRQSMNKALGNIAKKNDVFDNSKLNGLFRCTFNLDDPFQEKDKNGNFKKRKTTLYYVDDPSNSPPELPVRGNAAYDRIVKSLDARIRLAHLEQLRNEATYRTTAEMIEEEMRNMSLEQEEEDPVPDTAAPVLEQDYFDSPEAKKLFLGDKTSAKSVRDVLENRIAKLQRVNRYGEGWREVVEQHDKDNLCTEHNIYVVRQRCQVLCLAYLYALQHVDRHDNQKKFVWNVCCSKVSRAVHPLGIEVTSRTIQNWNILFRANREKFRVTAAISKSKSRLPDLLEYFEDIKDEWVSYCIEKLADLTHQLAQTYMNDVLIPKLREKPRDKYSSTQFIIMQRYEEKGISETTAWRWMRRLGFRYDNTKKTFYVDGHERPDVVVHRNWYTTEYLSVLEPRCFRWIQLSKRDAEKLKADHNIETTDERGYHYTDDNGVEMVEYHVDDYDFLHGLAKEMGYKFGGTLSVRMPDGVKPLILFGQDECVFSQYLMGSRQWVGPSGERALLPKNEGMGLMVSAFQSREFGFGFEITAEQLAAINLSRRGQKYVDEEAADEVRGKAEKADLTDSPFVKFFELGMANEGYWNYNHMALQFEDCIDCLVVMYPEYEFAFSFDHSQGHAKKLVNGLNASDMNAGYGGNQPTMEPSEILAEEGYLGPIDHPKKLKVGDKQYFVFESTDDGPFWMSPEERERTRHDYQTGVTNRNKYIAELKADLAQYNILDNRRSYRLAELQEIARSKNIPLRKDAPVYQKGWEGKPKGLKQVLWERGFIEEMFHDEYTINPRCDANGDVIPEKLAKRARSESSRFFSRMSRVTNRDWILLDAFVDR